MRKTGLLWRWTGLAAIAAIMITAGGWFQATLSGSEVPVPTIRVSTHLVVVDVVVIDKQGKLVRGLKQDDFAVQEKGKSQKIVFFSSPSTEQKQPAPDLPPGIYSNKPEYRSPGGPLVVLLLDAANTPFKDQAYARQQMLKFVEEQYKPGQRMAIFTLTNGLSILQDFTTDPSVLLAALKKYQPVSQEMANAAAPRVPSTSSDGGKGAQLAAAGMVERMREFQNIQLAYVQDRRVETTTAAMRGLARILGGMPGRKSVVWVTAAFPFSLIPEDRSISEAEMAESLPTIRQLGLGTRAAGSMAGIERTAHAQEIREASAQLSSAQIAIYPIDARGLMSGMEATSDVVVFLNNDIEATQQGWLETIVDSVEPMVLVGARIRSDPHTIVDSVVYPYIDGYCLAGTRDDLLELGGFDETLEEPAYYSDNLLCLEARARGFTLREAKVGLIHLVGGTANNSPDVNGATRANHQRYQRRVRALAPKGSAAR